MGLRDVALEESRMKDERLAADAGGEMGPMDRPENSNGSGMGEFLRLAPSPKAEGKPEEEKAEAE